MPRFADGMKALPLMFTKLPVDSFRLRNPIFRRRLTQRKEDKQSRTPATGAKYPSGSDLAAGGLKARKSTFNLIGKKIMNAPNIAIIRTVPIAQIHAPSNVRQSNGHDKASLSELAASIKRQGLLQPIIVRNSSKAEAEALNGMPYVIVIGRRRLAACKIAGLVEIAAIKMDTDESNAYEMEIAENIQREQMTLADTARAVRTLMLIHDNNTKTIKKILNKSPAWISKHLTITSNTFPATIAELLDRGIVDDLETLLLLRQIANMPASHPGAAATLTHMLRIAHAGEMNRQTAKHALDKLRAAPAHSSPEDAANSSEKNDAESGNDDAAESDTDQHATTTGTSKKDAEQAMQAAITAIKIASSTALLAGYSTSLLECLKTALTECEHALDVATN